MVSMETRTPDLNSHLGYWLRRVSNHVSGSFAKALQARHTSVAEWVVMCQVEERPGITPAELAAGLDLTRGAVSKIIDKLEAKRWVAHAAKPGDGRVQLLSLTGEGRRVLPELAEIASEPRSVIDAYGAEPGKNSFANNCLMARRLVERGVRMIQLYHRGWDTHGASNDEDIVNRLTGLCRETDRASAALVNDLEQRGLLKDTIVVWGGEFGRTPMNEARSGSKFLGRDHHARAFTMWLAGGGFKPGVTVGKTDEVGYNIIEDPVSVHDLHATMLHQLGIDHTKLTFRFQGRDFRLTDVHGEVVQKMLV